MPKPRNCNQSVAILMRKFGLPAVQAAVEMAIELSKPAPQPKKKAMPKQKAAAAVVSEVHERFEK